MEGPRPARADEARRGGGALEHRVRGLRRRTTWALVPDAVSAGRTSHLRVFVDGGRPWHSPASPGRRVVAPGILLHGRVRRVGLHLKEFHQGRGLGTRLMDRLRGGRPGPKRDTLLISAGRDSTGAWAASTPDATRRQGTGQVGADRVRSLRLGLRRDRRAVRCASGAWPTSPAWRGCTGRNRSVSSEEQVWYALLAHGTGSDQALPVWVVTATDRPEHVEAYLAVKEAVDTPEGRTSTVPELAGSRVAVLSGLPQVMDAMRADRADVTSSPRTVRWPESPPVTASRSCHGIPRHGEGDRSPAPDSRPPASRRPRVPIEAGADGLVFRHGTESFAVRGLDEVTAFLFVRSSGSRAARSRSLRSRSRLLPDPPAGLRVQLYIEKCGCRKTSFMNRGTLWSDSGSS